MPPTTVEQKASLDPQQRDWLKTMAAALQVKLGESAPQADGTAADADLASKCKQVKAAVAPRVKDAIAADPSKTDKIKQLLKTATAQESTGAFAEAFETLKELATTVKEALQKTAPATSPSAPSTVAATDPEPSSTATATAAPPTATAAPPSAPAEAPPSPSKPADPVQEQAPPKSAEEEAYDKELKVVKSLADALNKHAHKAHITGELTSIGTELGNADTAFKAKKYADAMKALEKAKDLAGKAKDFADKYEAYAKKRAEAQFLTHAFSDLLKRRKDLTEALTTLDIQIQAITDADNLANPPTRNYAAATTKVEGVITKLKGIVTAWYVTPNTPRIQALKAGTTKTFLDEQIKVIEAEMGILTASISAKDYRKALLQGPKVDSLVDAATEASSRRTAFDTQRVKTVAAIDGLKTFKALSPQIDDLNKRLKAADDLASIETRQFENAVECLTKVESDGKALAANGPAAETYANDRSVADQAYRDLASYKQAVEQTRLLVGIKTKLDKAAELAKDPAKFAAANAELKLARHEIDAATKAFGEADALGVVAGNASDAATGKKSLDALKISLAATKKNKSAADFANEFTALDAKVASAEKKLKNSKTVPDAITEIKTIGDDLGKVIIRLSQQEGYAADWAALNSRLQKVKALPEAAAIDAEIKPLEKALKDAESYDKAHKFDKRAEAMEMARAAADLAEKTAADCKSFNARQQKLESAVAASALSTAEKKQVTDLIKPATNKATALKYDDATKLLVKAEAVYESLLIGGFAKQTPPDVAKIEAAAKRMMDSGSAKQIDKLIQDLPDTTKFDVLKTLAKERFGVELKDDTAEATTTISAKAMLDMMAMVPDDIVGNPSLKTVERRSPDENGGWYERGPKLVVMKGRPGQRQQGFGAAIAHQLPADVEPDCQAVDAATPVDYFDYATLHELGHSVDDNLQFMASREGKAEFGNWRTYGGNVDPIVDAVAAHYKYDSTPEQKKAISDLIQGNQVTWPTPPAATPADKVTKWNDAQQAVIDWHLLAKVSNKVWWKQADIDKIKIKVGAAETVFAEAYDRQWVSYDYAARKKGLTGYQFRAPGEWFAELYAGYRIGKLQPSHPAVSWLSKLKV